MELSAARQRIFDEIDLWHSHARCRLNSIAILYAHYSKCGQNGWPTAAKEAVRTVRDQARVDGDPPAWMRRYFSSVVEEEIISYAGMTGTSALEVAFKLTDRMMSVGVTESFVGMLKPLDSLVPLIFRVEREFDRVGHQLNDIADPDEIIAILNNRANLLEDPLNRPRGSKQRNSRKARIKKLLRHGVFPGK